MSARGPFRDPLMRAAFSEDVAAFERRSRALFEFDGRRHTRSSRAVYFWRGFDNVRPEAWDAASRRLLGYADYRAGQHCASLGGAA